MARLETETRWIASKQKREASRLYDGSPRNRDARHRVSTKETIPYPIFDKLIDGKG